MTLRISEVHLLLKRVGVHAAWQATPEEPALHTVDLSAGVPEVIRLLCCCANGHLIANSFAQLVYETN